MGATLSSRAQWTSVSDDAAGKLEINPQNEQLLMEIADFTQAFPSKHPAESVKIFNKPFVWKSGLDPISFTSLDDIEARLVFYHNYEKIVISLQSYNLGT